MENLNTKEGYILYRDDIESPAGVKTVQMSHDLLRICGEALKEQGKLGDNPDWFFHGL